MDGRLKEENEKKKEYLKSKESGTSWKKSKG